MRMNSLFKLAKKSSEDQIIDPNTYIYTEPEEVHYVSITSSCKTLQHMFQSTYLKTMKSTRESERRNVINYYNNHKANNIRLSDSELFDLSSQVNQQVTTFNTKKGNIMNTIFFFLVFLTERQCGFSIELLHHFIPVTKKYKSQTFNKKFNDIYKCLEQWKPSVFHHKHTYYLELPMIYYLRGLTLIMRSFFMNYTGADMSIEVELGDKDIKNFHHSQKPTTLLQELARWIENSCLVVATWIVLAKADFVHATRISDYYKIYVLVLLSIFYDIPPHKLELPDSLKPIFFKLTHYGLRFPLHLRCPKVYGFAIYMVEVLLGCISTSVGSKNQTINSFMLSMLRLRNNTFPKELSSDFSLLNFVVDLAQGFYD